ncbi:hypothetical protein F5Y18DRAFT_375357 [Xylariaceae sp. FL1019]|nr:hypothetical protein F5Y18DRAFT_375357 [Xylariaceae sp. FL1019]
MTDLTTAPELSNQKIHPFFSGPKPILLSNSDDVESLQPQAHDAVTPPTPDPSCSPPSDRSNDADHDERGQPAERKRKRRKTDPPAATAEDHVKKPRGRRSARASTGGNILAHFSKDGQGHVEQGPDQQQLLNPTASTTYPPSTPSSTPTVDAAQNILTNQENIEQNSLIGSRRPHKLLKLNPKTGTIGSPPPPKPTASISDTVPTRTASKRGRKPKKLIVSIPYGADAESRAHIGQRINQILDGSITLNVPASATNVALTSPPASQTSTKSEATKTATPKKRSPKKSRLPLKPDHPFFQQKGKAGAGANVEKENAPKEDKTSPKRRVIFTSTPCSPKRPVARQPNFAMKNIGSKNGILRTPGARDPAWPWQGAAHVRDNPDLNLEIGKPVDLSGRKRKSKRQEIRLAHAESVLEKSATELHIPQLAKDLQSVNNEDLNPVSRVVRVPVKHFESGRKLRRRISQQLRTIRNPGASVKTHPAILQLYNNIESTLSAFDRATCESSAWTQKYGPTSAQCILQNGREAELLRDWLQTLKVQSVDTGSLDNGSNAKGGQTLKKKRRRKNLDDFVISSDEEADDMDQLPDGEPDWMGRGGRGNTLKTVLRSGDVASRGGKNPARLTNAVLLSGPHGCGKTAAVYAIAKELDFEVFEIHAGARRSGKDILERVGDMTRNHLVHHQQKDDVQDDAPTEDETERDLKSGKQGRMDSFFKPKAGRTKKEAMKPATQQMKKPTSQLPAQQDTKKTNRDQKQSLILLEEVDILYDEDKQFWATVMTMIAQSKRPFIMTCNDETIVPFQSLKLHGIFRFSPPPADLAVDLLLSMAACEGHALDRDSVEALYDSRCHDLRASITELNYWCQIGVGALRGGVDWFFPRWPRGCDIDSEGQTIRVVSQGTYHRGMGWFNRDSEAATHSLRPHEEEMHREAWDFWGLDISDTVDSEEFLSRATEATRSCASNADRRTLLNEFATFADLMSDSDLCGPFIADASNKVPLDATLPTMHNKTLDDFTIGLKVLEAPSLCRYNTTAMEMSSSLRNMAQSRLQNSSGDTENEPMRRLSEEEMVTRIRSSFRDSPPSELTIVRKDYSVAFDPIAASDKILANGYLDPSVFDRTMRIIGLDIAPYVRSIVAYDQRLQSERRVRSNLISEGGKPDKKRMRTTRAAMSALEGGTRTNTRREKYFSADINPYLVLRTGGKSWQGLGPAIVATDEIPVAAEADDTDIDGSSD